MSATHVSTQSLSKHELLMLLLSVGPNGLSSSGVSGITRLQKFLFLLWQESQLKQIGDEFDFKPYKAGPYSKNLYDELEFLENIGLIHSEIQGEASEIEAADLEALTFEQLMGDDADPFLDDPKPQFANTSDIYEERRFAPTAKGVELIKAILDRSDAKVVADGIRKIKTKYGNFSLQDLLYHVYTKYEKGGWTSASEIRSKVLSRGRSG